MNRLTKINRRRAAFTERLRRASRSEFNAWIEILADWRRALAANGLPGACDRKAWPDYDITVAYRQLQRVRDVQAYAARMNAA